MSAVDQAEASSHVGEVVTLYQLTDCLYRARTADDVYSAALDAIMSILGCARASILLFDEAGVMRFVASRGLSKEYRAGLEGHTPWKPGQRAPSPIFVSDIDRTDEPDWIKQTIKGEGIRALSFIPLVAHGGTVGKFMTYYEATRYFSPHEQEIAVAIARQIGFSIERALSERARQRAERELRESEARFRLMVEHAPIMIWMSDANGKCLHLNKALRDFWGVADADLEKFDWSHTIHPDDQNEVGRVMMDAMQRRVSARLMARYRDAQGRYRILQTDARPRLAEGSFVGMIGVNSDVTEREEAEAARRQAESHREILIAELNHRVKNTLSVVQAIAHQTFRGTADEACQAFSERLAGLARSHDLLTRSNWENVSLEDLARASLEFDGDAGKRIALHGPPVLLRPRQAVAFGMAFHELMTNALKYGALSTSGGTVNIDWALIGNNPPRLDLVWREKGGPPVSPPTHSGFGSLLLQRIVKGDLNAEVRLDFQRSGFACTISANLTSSQRGRTD